MASHGSRLSLIALLGVALVAGCASPPRRSLAHLPGKNACFWTRDVFDWTVLDDSTLLVHAPAPGEAYLIKLFAPIPGLAFHDRLGFQGGDGEPGRFCRDNGYVIVFGAIPERQPIWAVRALTPAQAERLLDRAGKPALHRQAGSKSGTPSS